MAGAVDRTLLARGSTASAGAFPALTGGEHGG